MTVMSLGAFAADALSQGLERKNAETVQNERLCSAFPYLFEAFEKKPNVLSTQQALARSIDLLPAEAKLELAQGATHLIQSISSDPELSGKFNGIKSAFSKAGGSPSNAMETFDKIVESLKDAVQACIGEKNIRPILERPSGKGARMIVAEEIDEPGDKDRTTILPLAKAIYTALGKPLPEIVDASHIKGDLTIGDITSPNTVRLSNLRAAGSITISNIKVGGPSKRNGP